MSNNADFVKEVLSNKQICNDFDDIMEDGIFNLFGVSRDFMNLYERYEIENLPYEEGGEILKATFLALIDNFKKNYYGCE